MKLNQCLTLAISVFLVLACKKDGLTDEKSTKHDPKASNNDDPRISEEAFDSFITLSMTGDESGEFSSDANTSLSGTPKNGYIYILTRGPEDALSNQSFYISIITKYIDMPTLPIATGSYDLVAEKDLQNGDGNYTIQFTTNDEMYGKDVSGTLNITESNDSFVKGDFNFTATNFTKGEKEVEVSGTFQAPTSY